MKRHTPKALSICLKQSLPSVSSQAVIARSSLRGYSLKTSSSRSLIVETPKQTQLMATPRQFSIAVNFPQTTSISGRETEIVKDPQGLIQQIRSYLTLYRNYDATDGQANKVWNIYDSLSKLTVDGESALKLLEPQDFYNLCQMERGKLIRMTDSEARPHIPNLHQTKYFNSYTLKSFLSTQQRLSDVFRSMEKIGLEVPASLESILFLCQPSKDLDPRSFWADLDDWRNAIRKLPIAEQDDAFKQMYENVFIRCDWAGMGKAALDILRVAEQDATLPPRIYYLAHHAMSLENKEISLGLLAEKYSEKGTVTDDVVLDALLPEFVRLLMAKDAEAAKRIITALADAEKLHPDVLASYLSNGVRLSERLMHQGNFKRGDRHYAYDKEAVRQYANFYEDLLQYQSTKGSPIVMQVPELTSSYTPEQQTGHASFAAYLECLFVLGESNEAFDRFCRYLGTVETQPRLKMNQQTKKVWDVVFAGLTFGDVRKDVERAQRLFDEMFHSNKPYAAPESRQVIAIMMAWARLGDLDKVWKLYQTLPEMGWSPGAAHLGALIRAAGREPTSDKVWSLFTIGSQQLGLVTVPAPSRHADWISSESVLVAITLDAIGYFRDEALLWKAWYWPRPVPVELPKQVPWWMVEREDNAYTSLIEALMRINSKSSLENAIHWVTNYMPSISKPPTYKTWVTMLRFLAINGRIDLIRQLGRILQRQPEMLLQIEQGFRNFHDPQGNLQSTATYLGNLRRRLLDRSRNDDSTIQRGGSVEGFDRDR